ncbi:MAG: VOC family protein [Microthrixaceae bacterium]
MRPQLNHTIVNVRSKVESADFIAELLGFDDPFDFMVFRCIETGNGATLDFVDAGDFDFQPQHYAFLVTEAQFDEIFDKIVGRGIEHWADPGLQRVTEINDYDGGRGVYFCEPSGHLLEIITRSYGTGPRPRS